MEQHLREEHGHEIPSNTYDRGELFVAIGGVALIYGAMIAFGFVVYGLLNSAAARYTDAILYIPEAIVSLIGAFGAILGVKLLRSVGLAKRQQPAKVINNDEWQVIAECVKQGEEEPISQYIRLTSLTGFTGAFTKLGLTGLPLATIGLTLFFSILSMFYADTFLDLAKLTLGAFIGSFVQKQVSSAQAVPVRLAGGDPV